MTSTQFVATNGAKYIAVPKDDSLEAYLVEALILLEIRFAAFDDDDAGYLCSRYKPIFSRLARSTITRCKLNVGNLTGPSSLMSLVVVWQSKIA